MSLPMMSVTSIDSFWDKEWYRSYKEADYNTQSKTCQTAPKKRIIFEAIF